jgi:hypothetical protein
LDELKQAGVAVDPNRENYDYRRLPRSPILGGNRIELWEMSKLKE